MWGVQDLGVVYGDRRAVHGVSLTVRRGGVTALVGGDGAGKTTILRTMVGSVPAERGRVTTAQPHEIGYMSAGPGVYRDLTVEENLKFSGRAYGFPTETLGQRIGELLDRTGLEAARRRLAGKLSGGMRQKLALAMAVLHRPSLLVLDEPTTGVDPVSRAELWRLIAGEAANGAAVLMATSYLDEAERAEEVVVLVDGTVLMSGAPAEIVSSLAGPLMITRSRPEIWRRGRSWRIWSGEPFEADEINTPPDLEDVVVIGELMRERGSTRSRRAVGA
jgi:ABC-2 type transport system ATP-binding protein